MELAVISLFLTPLSPLPITTNPLKCLIVSNRLVPRYTRNARYLVQRRQNKKAFYLQHDYRIPSDDLTPASISTGSNDRKPNPLLRKRSHLPPSRCALSPLPPSPRRLRRERYSGTPATRRSSRQRLPILASLSTNFPAQTEILTPLNFPPKIFFSWESALKPRPPIAPRYTKEKYQKTQKHHGDRQVWKESGKTRGEQTSYPRSTPITLRLPLSWTKSRLSRY